MRKDSLEIDTNDRAELRRIIVQTQSSGFVVTHGTDTLVETALALSGIPDKTIVLTGAMLPERFSESDADFNLGMATAVAQIMPPGVYVCMHGLVIPADKADRDMETGQFRFRP